MAEPDEKQAVPATATPEAESQPSTTKSVPAVDDDSDPDFDDLDDVLDQFSANAPASTTQPSHSVVQPPSQSTPASSGPGRPSNSDTAIENESETPVPTGPKPNESEEDFMARLSAEMSTMLGSLTIDPSNSAQSPEEIVRMGKELENFTYKMEREGIKPEDLLKALLGEEEGNQLADLAKQERDRLDKPSTQPSSSSSQQQSQSSPAPQSPSTAKSDQQRPTSSSSSNKPPAKSFEDTIRSTMSRLGESDKSATTAAQKQSTAKSEEDLLADMLRALETSGSGDPGTGGEDGLSKMFLDMMQQLTHKDLLYEPMKELNEQYPDWLRRNRDKLPADEHARYTRQAAIVAAITRKFEEAGFDDDNPACRDYIWEQMQKMQEEGAPPEELVKNPLPGTDLAGIPGLGGGGGGELPEGLTKELEEGCPTQ